MNYYIGIDRYGNYDLAHHGIKGMRWGVRRYQNPDGSLTSAGKTRYNRYESPQEIKDLYKWDNRTRAQKKIDNKIDKQAYKDFRSGKKVVKTILDEHGRLVMDRNDPNYPDYIRALRHGKKKTNRAIRRLALGTITLAIAGGIAGSVYIP